MVHTLKKIITGVILALLGHCVYFFAPAYIASLILASVPCLIFIFEWPQLLTALTQKHKNLPKVTFTLVYLFLPFMLMIALNYHQPRWLLLLFFYMVFMNDTGGYVVGSLWGKHKLSKYSPNKSWEGVFGGFLFSGIIAYLVFWWNAVHVAPLVFLFFVSVITASSVLGDLFESYLKRLAHVKDSGNWLPGHGGLLDRFDSCMLSSIVFYAFVYYVI